MSSTDNHFAAPNGNVPTFAVGVGEVTPRKGRRPPGAASRIPSRPAATRYEAAGTFALGHGTQQPAATSQDVATHSSLGAGTSFASTGTGAATRPAGHMDQQPTFPPSNMPSAVPMTAGVAPPPWPGTQTRPVQAEAGAAAQARPQSASAQPPTFGFGAPVPGVTATTQQPTGIPAFTLGVGGGSPPRSARKNRATSSARSLGGTTAASSAGGAAPAPLAPTFQPNAPQLSSAAVKLNSLLATLKLQTGDGGSSGASINSSMGGSAPPQGATGPTSSGVFAPVPVFQPTQQQQQQGTSGAAAAQAAATGPAPMGFAVGAGEWTGGMGHHSTPKSARKLKQKTHTSPPKLAQLGSTAGQGSAPAPVAAPNPAPAPSPMQTSPFGGSAAFGTPLQQPQAPTAAPATEGGAAPMDITPPGQPTRTVLPFEMSPLVVKLAPAPAPAAAAAASAPAAQPVFPPAFLGFASSSAPAPAPATAAQPVGSTSGTSGGTSGMGAPSFQFPMHPAAAASDLFKASPLLPERRTSRTTVGAGSTAGSSSSSAPSAAPFPGFGEGAAAGGAAAGPAAAADVTMASSSSSAAFAAAVAAKKGNLIPDPTGGNSCQAGNDCQPPKDSSPKLFAHAWHAQGAPAPAPVPAPVLTNDTNPASGPAAPPARSSPSVPPVPAGPSTAPPAPAGAPTQAAGAAGVMGPTASAVASMIFGTQPVRSGSSSGPGASASAAAAAPAQPKAPAPSVQLPFTFGSSGGAGSSRSSGSTAAPGAATLPGKAAAGVAGAAAAGAPQPAAVGGRPAVGGLSSAVAATLFTFGSSGGGAPPQQAAGTAAAPPAAAHAAAAAPARLADAPKAPPPPAAPSFAFAPQPAPAAAAAAAPPAGQGIDVMAAARFLASVQQPQSTFAAPYMASTSSSQPAAATSMQPQFQFTATATPPADATPPAVPFAFKGTGAPSRPAASGGPGLSASNSAGGHVPSPMSVSRDAGAAHGSYSSYQQARPATSATVSTGATGAQSGAGGLQFGGGNASEATSAPFGLGGAPTGAPSGPARHRAKVTPRKNRTPTSGSATASTTTFMPAQSTGAGAPAPAAAPAAAAPGAGFSHLLGKRVGAPTSLASSAAAVAAANAAAARSAAAPAAAKPQQQAAAAPPGGAQRRSSGGAAAAAGSPSDEAHRRKAQADMLKQQGNSSYEKQQFAAAEASYSQAIAAAEALRGLLPDDHLKALFPTLQTEVAVLYSNRSGARLMTGKPQSALDDAQRACALDPRFFRAVSRAATCYCRLGDFASATAHLAEALSRLPAGSQHQQDLYKKMLEVQDLSSRAAGLASEVAAACQGSGAAAAASKEALQGLAAKLKALQEQVAYCEVMGALRACVALRLAQPQDALGAMQPHPETAADKRSPPWRLWLQLQARYQRGELQEAVAVAKDLQAAGSEQQPRDDGTEAAPAPPHAYSLAAHVRVPGAGALRALQGSLEQQLALKEAGNAAIKAGKPQVALEKYSEALALGCTAAFAAVLHCNRAAAHQALGALTDAVADCARAKALDPAYWRAYARMAALLLELRRPAGAQAVLEELFKSEAGTGSSSSVLAGVRAEDVAGLRERLAEAKSTATWQKTPHHYKLLGLDQGCSDEDVRKTYRKLALKHHPDKALTQAKLAWELPGLDAAAAAAPGAAAGPAAAQQQCCVSAAMRQEVEARLKAEAAWLFNLINQANEELSDKSRRRRVDQLLEVEEPVVPLRTASGYGSSYGAGSAAYGGAGSTYGGYRAGAGFGAYGDPFAAFYGRAAGAAGSRAAGGARSGASNYGSAYYNSRPGGTSAANGANGRAGTAGAGASRGASSAAGGRHSGASAGAGAQSGNARRNWWDGGSDEDDSDAYY